MFGLNTAGVKTASGERAVPLPSEDERSSLLIIEDDPIHGTLIAHIAERVGFTTEIAGCYEHACTLLDAQQFDCITLDLGLGGHDGADVLNYLSQIRSKRTIIIISGLDEALCGDAVRIGQWLKLNIREVVRKPIDLTTLRDTLTKIRTESRMITYTI